MEASGRLQAEWLEYISGAAVRGDTSSMSQCLALQDVEVDMLSVMTPQDLITIAGMTMGDAIRLITYSTASVQPKPAESSCLKMLEIIPIVNVIYDVFGDGTPLYESVEQLLNVLSLVSALVIYLPTPESERKSEREEEERERASARARERAMDFTMSFLLRFSA
jgi:hypothetical protein